MIKPAVLDAMVAAGCTAEQIAAAVKADQTSSSGASRQARYRAKKAAKSDDSDATSVTKRNDDVTHLSPKETSPTPPKEITPIPVSEPSGSSTKIRDGQFSEWWEVYPRKVSKADARKQFDKALTVTDFATLMAGARRFAVERRGQEQQFTMHPDRWLRGLHWNDEPALPPMPRATAPPGKRMNAVEANEAIWNQINEQAGSGRDSEHVEHVPADNPRLLQLVSNTGQAMRWDK